MINKSANLIDSTGEKILDAWDKYRDFHHPLGEGPAARFFQKLSKKPLGLSDYFEYLAHLRTLPAQLPINMGKCELKLDIKSRMLSSTFGHVVLNDKFFDPKFLEYYVPHFITFHFGKSLYIEEFSRMPIRFSAEHVADRYKLRTGTDLDISSDSFLYSLVAGLMLSLSFEDKIIKKRNNKPRAMLIPHEKGLFVGSVGGVPLTFYARNFYGAYREHKLPYFEHGFINDDEQPLRPQAEISIRTFYSFEECKGGLNVIRNRLVDACNRAIVSGVFEFCRSSHISSGWNKKGKEDLIKAAQQTFSELQEIISSKEWLEAEQEMREKKHIPSKSVMGKITQGMNNQRLRDLGAL